MTRDRPEGAAETDQEQGPHGGWITGGWPAGWLRCPAPDDPPAPVLPVGSLTKSAETDRQAGGFAEYTLPDGFGGLSPTATDLTLHCILGVQALWVSSIGSPTSGAVS